jgi:hypothetical protein
MNFTTKCYNTQNTQNYNTQTINVVANGQCTGVANFALYCDPIKQVQPPGYPYPGNANGAPYIWNKNTPPNSPAYNQVFFTPVNSFFNIITDTCYQKNGNATTVQCPTQACGCILCRGARDCNGPCSSPVVVDVTGAGFLSAFTNYNDGASFDIDGSGLARRMAWVKKGGGVAFLARPGADGLVHNGTQLFGNFTPQPSIADPNGFNALEPFDLNHDGWIDDKEAAAAGIVLWWDKNGDGICTKDELYTLPQLGLTGISLHYHQDNLTDQYGNHLALRTKVTGETDRTAYDVYFVLCPN